MYYGDIAHNVTVSDSFKPNSNTLIKVKCKLKAEMRRAAKDNIFYLFAVLKKLFLSL
jgi:hypothetical protein